MRICMLLAMIVGFWGCTPDTDRTRKARVFTIEILDDDLYTLDGKQVDRFGLQEGIRQIGDGSRHPTTGVGHKMRWVIRSPKGSSDKEARRLTTFLSTQGFPMVRYEKSGLE